MVSDWTAILMYIWSGESKGHHDQNKAPLCGVIEELFVSARQRRVGLGAQNVTTTSEQGGTQQTADPMLA